MYGHVEWAPHPYMVQPYIKFLPFLVSFCEGPWYKCNNALQCVPWYRVRALWRSFLYLVCLEHEPAEACKQKFHELSSCTFIRDSFWNPSSCQVKGFDSSGQNSPSAKHPPSLIFTPRTGEEISAAVQTAVYPRLIIVLGSPSTNNYWLSNVNIRLLLPIKPCVGSSYIFAPTALQQLS